MPTPVTLPTVFESLAGTCKFMAVARISPAFYAKHWQPIEFTSAFVRLLVGSYSPLENAFRASLPLPLSEGAVPIQQALSSLAPFDEKLSWFDNQMTEVLRVLLPVVRDPALPGWLSECKWAVEGAFTVPRDDGGRE